MLATRHRIIMEDRAATVEASLRERSTCKDLLIAVEHALDVWRYEALRHGSDDDVLQALHSFFQCEEDIEYSYLVMDIEDWELEVDLRESLCETNTSTPFEWRRSIEQLKQNRVPDTAWSEQNGRWRDWIMNRGRLAWMIRHEVEWWRDYVRR